MRIYLAAIALTGTLLAGCSSDWDPARNTNPHASVQQADKDALLPTATLAARNASVSFASLPDRGELLSYAMDREVRRSGAYTSHPVEISEAHALNAIAAGGLHLSTPDGKPVNVVYDRIEEHPDGNWTWIGQSENGDHAVLTFGERAVFGEIRADGKSFRVTTRGGSAWMVETNNALLVGNHPGHHGDGPEVLLPPRLDESGIGMAGAKAMSAASDNVETKSSAGVIDLALGYTNGFVTANGNQATAITRLINLVDLGNAAYQRSGVNMRLRLVHAVQVNFTDTSDNADALQKLTGYNATTRQFTTPDPAFNALREARDEYGADVVALVRPHRAPEQKGCGIAWLLGAGQSPITAADAPFAYSVVSDGSDVNETNGNTYFCSDYSLAHELGHTMGQAHNQADSEYAGVHAYSYGYRETSSTGFHTIMAYPINNSSQFEAPYFATPNLNYSSDRPLGVANTSDNVRSMNQTMPIIATFRQTVVPLVDSWSIAATGDLTGDGRADIFWHRTSLRAAAYWSMSGPSQTGLFGNYEIDERFEVLGKGDFNADGLVDILWADRARTEVWIWEARPGGGFIAKYVRGYPAGWEFSGIGDFNRDGRADIIWHNLDTGQVLPWYMTGSSSSIGPGNVVSGFRIHGVGDFNADGYADIFWIDNARSQVWVWLNNGAGGFSAHFLAPYPTGWSVVGIADFNGDNRADIAWSHATAGLFGYWRMSGTTYTFIGAFEVATRFSVAGVNDFNGDGRADVLWRDSNNTELWMWVATPTGGSFNPYRIGTYPL